MCEFVALSIDFKPFVKASLIPDIAVVSIILFEGPLEIELLKDDLLT